MNNKSEKPSWIRQSLDVLQRKEPDRSSWPLGIFIDDEDIFALLWEECFKVQGFLTLRPDIPHSNNPGKDVEIREKITAFIEGITEQQLAQIAIIILDQFVDNQKLFDTASKFIRRLRAVNETAYILETSSDPHGQKYYKSNNIITNGSWTVESQTLIQESPANPAARMAALKTYSVPAFIDAGLSDFNPKRRSDNYEDKRFRNASFRRLDHNPQFRDVLQLLGFNPEHSSYEMFSNLSSIDQRLFLHCAWTIIGHKQLGNGEEYWGGSLTRLKTLLKLEN